MNYSSELDFTHYNLPVSGHSGKTKLLTKEFDEFQFSLARSLAYGEIEVHYRSE